MAVAPGFEPGVACTTQHFECCTFGRSDTLPRLLNLPEITANTQTLLTQPHSHRKYTPQTRHAGSDNGQGDVGPQSQPRPLATLGEKIFQQRLCLALTQPCQHLQAVRGAHITHQVTL